MSKYEELKQKIIEAVPELWQEHEQVYRRDDEGYSILDRIMLEDVLMAIELRKPTIKITDTESVNYGDVVDITEEEKTRIMLAWQFGKPLSEQPEETINFLHGIIVK